MAKFSICALVLLASAIACVSGHGRLLVPPSRSSIWKHPEFFHLDPPINYNDNELFCGGLAVQIANGNRCGECGDAWNEPRPRQNEEGGEYARNIIITRQYQKGQEINVEVDLTANHLGYFQFRLCPHNNMQTPVNQDCLDQNILQLADGSGTQYRIFGHEMGIIPIRLRLPAGVTCYQCVLQWHYKTGNSYGECEDGSYDIGCGPQETFRGCADVAIY